jgi:hypothetical protein
MSAPEQALSGHKRFKFNAPQIQKKSSADTGKFDFLLYRQSPVAIQLR